MNTVSRPRLLIVIGTLSLGGAEKHLLTILPLLLDRYDITVYTTASRGVLESLFIEQGVQVFGAAQHIVPQQNSVMRIFRLSRRFFQICKHLQSKQYDMIHFFLPGSYLLGGVAAVLLRKKRLIMSRRSQNDYQQKHKVMAMIEKKLHQHMTYIVANSKKILNQLKEEGVTQKQLRLIYNGVVIPDDQAMRLNNDTLILMIVANLFFYKGHADLLQALSMIKGQLPHNWQLLCVGRDAGELKRLTQLADTLQLSSHIQWLGQRLDVSQLMAMTDIGLLVSHEEGFSNAVLEFMAAGKPMVVTDVGGNAEAIVEGVCGLVVPAKNSQSIAEAILKLAQDPALRVRYGIAARERVIEEFSVEQCVLGYDQLYQEVLRSH